MRFVTATALFGGSCLVAAAALAAPPVSGVPTAENIKIAAPPAAAQFTPQNGYTGDLTLLAKPHELSRVRGKAGSASSSKRSEDVAPLPPGADLLRFDQQLAKSRVGLPLLHEVNREKNGAFRFVPLSAPDVKPLAPK